MLEVSGIRFHLGQLDGTDAQELALCKKAAAKKLRVKPSQIAEVERRRRSIDARKRNDILVGFTLRVALVGGEPEEREVLDALVKSHAEKGICLAEPDSFTYPEAPLAWDKAKCGRPVVVGAGCAGLFCALYLARAGLEPLLIERGDDARRRSEVVANHNATGILDTQSNIQFGLGGAGTFSDGKLQTGTKSPAHRLILETFVAAGAQQRILWDAKPHVGSDVLPKVVENIVSQIRAAGGEVRFRCRMTDIAIENGQVSGITVAQETAEGEAREEKIAASDVVIACGHSARDVFELLKAKDVAMERKTFAMGVRIEHLQADIDRALYGRAAGNPALGAAPYKLSEHLPQGRSAFSFCMCPGGYVVSAASEKGGVVTNGMSLSDRAGQNANSGLLANVFPDDLPGDDVLAGIALQRSCERAAYAEGGGDYVAPAQLVGDFLQGVPSTACGKVRPTYPRGVNYTEIDGCLPDYITNTLRAAIPRMARKLRGFDAADAVLTGVETRSSSPVRVVRGQDGQSVDVRGLWPVGEGAGYAGGIMSAATDGILAAVKLVEHLG